jgi:hypothetical protein
MWRGAPTRHCTSMAEGYLRPYLHHDRPEVVVQAVGDCLMWKDACIVNRSHAAMHP